MLIPGTEMHWVTFGFICLEVLILFYLLLYRAARPDDTATLLNIVLLILLIAYNVTGGLLPDPKLPGSFFMQNAIAYATGFITPCYFPYYVYRGFELKKMKFHAYLGVFLCFFLPYIIFITVFAISGNLDFAKNIFIIPTLYAVWVVYSLVKAFKHKYNRDFSSWRSKSETIVVFLSLAPWVGLPLIDYLNLGQATEVVTTNTGFLLMMTFHLYHNVYQLRNEHIRLVESEEQLSSYDERLKEEIKKYAREREKMNAEERFARSSEIYQLTKRETEIARLVCAGLTDKAIGETLFISKRTVAKHIQNIFDKVNVSTRMELCQKLDATSLIGADD